MFNPPSRKSPIRVFLLIRSDLPFQIKLNRILFNSFNFLSCRLGKDVNRCTSFGITSVLTTVILPISVSFLCSQLLRIFDTSFILALKFKSTIELKSREKSRPRTLKLECVQFKFKFEHKISSEYFLLPTHSTWVFDLFTFNPETL